MAQFDPEKNISKLGRDVRLKQMRSILVYIVKNNKSDHEMKTVAVRLILRLGYIHATAEDLLVAAELQQTHQIDLTWDIMPLLDKSEKLRAFTPPSKVDESQGEPF